MSTEPLSPEARAALQRLAEKTPLLRLAKQWGMDRGTLAEAAQGYAKRASTRYVIESKLREAEG